MEDECIKTKDCNTRLRILMWGLGIIVSLIMTFGYGGIKSSHLRIDKMEQKFDNRFARMEKYDRETNERLSSISTKLDILFKVKNLK